MYSSSALMRVLQGLVLSTRMSKRTASRHHFALAYGGESIAFSVQEVLRVLSEFFIFACSDDHAASAYKRLVTLSDPGH